jgi:ATP-binding cassette subfamily B protein
MNKNGSNTHADMKNPVIARLFALTDKKSVALSAVSSAAGAVLALIIPVFIGRGVDAAADGVGSAVLTNAVIVALCGFASAMFAQLASRAANKMSYSLGETLRTDVFARFMDASASYMDAASRGDLLSRVSGDVSAVSEGVRASVTTFVSGVVTIVGTMVAMLAVEQITGAVVILLTPLSLIAAALIARSTNRTFREQSRVRGAVGAAAAEYIAGRETILACAAKADVCARYGDADAELYTVGRHAQFYSSLTNPATRFVNALVYAAAAVCGCLLLAGGADGVTAGVVAGFLAYAGQYTKPFNEISSVIASLQMAASSAQRIIDVIDAPGEDGGEAVDAQSRDDISAGADTQGGAPDVEFDRVTFGYKPDKPLFRNLSFMAERGAHIAIVGPTGCGKTTLVRLLLRFYDPLSGTIRVRGRDTAGMSRVRLRSHFAAVPQETWLCDGTIRDNIAYGKPDATDTQIEAAAEAANVAAAIKRLPDGYSTVVGDDGCGLSAGETQLIAVARAMLADPDILILDEATSSVDAATELKVTQAFERLADGRTAFVIAHRLATVRHADLILVMRSGDVVERGTHDALIAKGGFYAQLWNSAR